ncbi:(Fe-S)-binding protein [Mangrovibacterium marinum]|uniref:(Fe-S)-binding protein n=1 Tax=Mangrovibacterium marinum TaxID=1639118 RepID=UPI002A18D073|nr:(Fe-S)-binding protein [Mangrovibacterium marinum]
MEKTKNIQELLPGFNCRACGSRNCSEFSVKLEAGIANLGACPVLLQDRFQENKATLAEILNDYRGKKHQKPQGLIDGVQADFCLHPLLGESSCRETLACFSSAKLEEGQIIRYRPLGCPITHFGRIISINQGLLDVWVIGPCKLLGREESATNVGICMVLSFQGTIAGERPRVGQTVKFLPAHCMMGKVHSGIIVQLEDNRTRIDCIDLKVWEHCREF